MEYWKIHNQNNIAEQRFNQIKNYCDDWIWEKGSVVIFGGCWDDTSFSGSRVSIWDNAPSDSDSVISVCGVCDHLTLVNEPKGELTNRQNNS